MDVKFLQICLDLFGLKLFNSVSFNLVFYVCFKIFQIVFIVHVLVSTFPIFLVRKGFALIVSIETVLAASTDVFISMKDPRTGIRNKGIFLFEFDILYEQSIDLFVEKCIFPVILLEEVLHTKHVFHVF